MKRVNVDRMRRHQRRGRDTMRLCADGKWVDVPAKWNRDGSVVLGPLTPTGVPVFASAETVADLVRQHGSVREPHWTEHPEVIARLAPALDRPLDPDVMHGRRDRMRRAASSDPAVRDAYAAETRDEARRILRASRRSEARGRRFATWLT